MSSGEEKQGTAPLPASLVGAQGVSEIRLRLSRTDPRVAIPQFQSENGLSAPHAEDALEFLKLLGLSRAEVHANVLRRLRDDLLREIERAADDSPARLEALLERCFPFVGIDELRPVVVAVMMRLPRVPARFLGGLCDTPALVGRLPVELRRQVWESSLPLLQQVVGPRLDEFARSARRRWWRRRAGGGGSAAAREADPALQGVLAVVGSSVALYEGVQRTVFTRFAAAEGGSDPAYCVLRMELLMCYHDRATRPIYDRDPCHKLAWCLDAAVSGGEFTPRLVQELAAFVSAVPPRHPVTAHVAMIARHPLVLAALNRAVGAALGEAVALEALPREHEALPFFLGLMCAGLAAPALVSHAAAGRRDRLAFPKPAEGLWEALAGLAELRVRAMLGGGGGGGGDDGNATEEVVVSERLLALLVDCGGDASSTAAAREAAWHECALAQSPALVRAVGGALAAAPPLPPADGRTVAHAQALVESVAGRAGTDFAWAALEGALVPLASRPGVATEALRLVELRARAGRGGAALAAAVERVAPFCEDAEQLARARASAGTAGTAVAAPPVPSPLLADSSPSSPALTASPHG